MWGTDMSKPKLFPYVVYYRDQTFQTINITKADYELIAHDLDCGAKFTKISIGSLGLEDIRSIFERIEPTEKVEEQQPQEDDEDYPHLSLEDQAWLWEQKQLQEAAKKKQNTEVDYS